MKYGTLWFNNKSNRDVGVKVKGNQLSLGDSYL